MMAKTWGRTVAAGDAPFQFGPAEGPAYFTALGWRVEEYRAFLDEGIRLGRSFPFAQFWRWIGRFATAKRREEFKHFAGVMVLHRA
jgi:hypothetical protein